MAMVSKSSGLPICCAMYARIEITVIRRDLPYRYDSRFHQFRIAGN
jgi:hypothetical protein